MSQKKAIIGTHNGIFQADEVLACMLLKKYLYENAIVIRSRKQDVLEQADILVDVGGQYDPLNNKFDHHQEECNITFPKINGIPLSAVGLVWLEFGKKIISKMVDEGQQVTEQFLEDVHYQLYRTFFMEIDANDNGIAQFPNGTPTSMAYESRITLNSTISKMNSMNVWNDKQQYKQFAKAMDYAFETFEIHAHQLIRVTLMFSNDMKLTKKFLQKSNNYDGTGAILVTDVWVENLSKCLKTLGEYNNIIYIVAPRGKDEWVVNCLNVRKKRFTNKRDLLAENEMRQLLPSADVKNIIFVHKNKFTGAAKTKETAINMARTSLIYDTTIDRDTQKLMVDLQRYSNYTNDIRSISARPNCKMWVSVDDLLNINQASEAGKEKELQLCAFPLQGFGNVKYEFWNESEMEEKPESGNLIREFRLGHR